MNLLELLNLANEAYPDGYLSEYFHEHEELQDDAVELYNAEGSGDTLAECIIIELISAFRENPDAPDDALLSAAAHKLDNLVLATAKVAEHLRDKYKEVTRIR